MCISLPIRGESEAPQDDGSVVLQRRGSVVVPLEGVSAVPEGDLWRHCWKGYPRYQRVAAPLGMRSAVPQEGGAGSCLCI